MLGTPGYVKPDSDDQGIKEMYVQEEEEFYTFVKVTD